MKILNMYGQEYKYDDFGRPQYYEDMVMSICSRLKINRVILGKIIEVHVGSSDCPFNEMIMSSGITLYDENTCQIWTGKENNKAIKLLAKRRK